MDYFNTLINIIVIIVSIVSWLSYFSVILVILQKVTVKSIDLYQYKLKNKYLSILFSTVYILLFILALYGLRLYNLHRVVDLKEIYQSCLVILDILMLMPILLVFNLVLLCLLSLLVIIVLLLSINKFFMDHIFILYIYYTCSYNKTSERLKKIKIRLSFIGEDDIITYYFYQFMNLLSFKILGSNSKITNMSIPKYYLQSYISKSYLRIIIIFSPFIIIFYDCLFNNFILKYVYYYLLFYIPIMAIKRITNNIASQVGFMPYIIWNLYYKKESCIYACSLKEKPIIDTYLFYGFKDGYLNPDLEINVIDFHFYFNGTFVYELNNKERGTYMNGEGICLQKTSDNRVFQELETEDEDYNIIYYLGEEYILLADKTEDTSTKFSSFL